MSKVYDKAFKVGFGVNILLFLVANIFSYLISYDDHSNRNIKVGGYSWGFPFEMYRHYLGNPSDIGFTLKGAVLNTFVTVFCGFILGFIFKEFSPKSNQDNL